MRNQRKRLSLQASWPIVMGPLVSHSLVTCGSGSLLTQELAFTRKSLRIMRTNISSHLQAQGRRRNGDILDFLAA